MTLDRGADTAANEAADTANEAAGGACTECGGPGDEGLCNDCWAACCEVFGPDAGACPQCGGELTDIRGERTEADAAAGTEWGCWELRGRPDGPGLEYRGCGARGRYDDRDEPVAKEPDAERLDRMYGGLVGAMTSSSDPLRVRCLADRYASLCIMECGNMWLEDGEGRLLWCRDHESFEEEMGEAEGDLAREDFSHCAGGSHLKCCGDVDQPEAAAT